ncbi:BTAD domain-containing putative transcriptional regulator [Mycobacterium deserti]|uniref:AAA family ATPase n=1 Tax=Mycobacterium deserti TaxID=2978347 RepID=A0ABT2MFP2_9MYCO|nr:BTAD domain-containing putative transcriptional regulator [Mycobacterium deserti]MCT7661101.1 AAA family ATPase [Mycobacterium deserti]
MSQIRITLFGPMTVRVAGDLVELRGSQPRAILARLALAGGQTVSTDRIIDDIWAGEPPPKALGALQVHVSNLRRVLEPDRPRRTPARVLVSSPPGYALRLPDDAVDTWQFEAKLRSADADSDSAVRADLLRAALDCWAGAPLPEFADTNWAKPELARLNGLRATALEQYAALALNLGREAATIPELERHLAADPLREEAIRLLAIALYRVGRQSEALTHLRDARRRLADELGLEPGPALRALEADILAHSDSLLHRPSPPHVKIAPVGRDASPPPSEDRHRATVIGRTVELQRIATAAEIATNRGLRTVWVEAEAGVGKTTFADVVARRLSRGGWSTTRGRCPEVDGAPPAWAWIEVAQSLGDPIPTPETAFELAAVVRDRVQAATANGPLLVVLDDLHRADGATLQLLRSLAHDLAERPVLILAACRGTEAGPDLAATSAALTAVTAERLKLGGLNRDGVVALVDEFAPDGGFGRDANVIDRLIDRTDGNPLFVTEFARLIAAEGRSTATAELPAGVRDVLRRRLSRLPGTARTVLQQAAVLGREFDVDQLLVVARRDEDEVLDGLEAAVLAGLLSEPVPGRVRFTHALVRDTLYEDTPALRRTRWHAAALAQLQTTSSPDIATLAHHALAAATPATAPEAAGLAWAAARQAMEMNAPLEAIQLAEAAVRMTDLAQDGAIPISDRVGMLVDLTRAAAQAGAAAKARPARSRAVELATVAGDEGLLLAALTAYRAPISWTVSGIGSDSTSVEQPLRRALAEYPDADPVTRVWLLVALIFETENDAAAYGMTEVLAWSEEAVETARRSGDPVAVCAALNARVYLSLGPDLADEREELAGQLLSLAQDHNLLGYEALAHWLLFLCASGRTDITEAIRQADLAVERSTSGQLAALVQVVEVYHAVLCVLAGRIDEAASEYRRLARQMAETGMSSAAEAALVFELVLAFAHGDMAGLADIMIELHDVHPDAMNEALVLCLLDAGRIDEARIRWAARTPLRRNYYWLGRMALFARAAARLGDLDECAGAYEELLPWAGRVAGIDSGSVAFGVVDDALAILADALDRPADGDRHRSDADTVRARLATHLSAAGLIPR